MTHLDVRVRSRLSERFTLDVAFRFDFDAERPVAALFGPSGCGKSTTLALIAGLLSPDFGRIELDGIALVDRVAGTLLPPERRAVGLVAQDGLLFPHLSVGGNLAYAERRCRGRAHAARKEIVDVLELAPLMPRFTQTLSGGERQRAALARALLSGPRLLLLDEPVSALDESARWEALALIERVTRRFAVPALVVSHQSSEVARIAPQTARMADGRVVACGDTATVLAEALELGSTPNLLRAVYLGLDRARTVYAQGIGREQRHTLGAKWSGSGSRLDLNYDAIFQWGSFSGTPVRAWAFSTETGYRLSQTHWKPRLSVRADIASGDKDRTDPRLQAFNPLFPGNSYAGAIGLFGPTNLTDLTPALRLLPHQRVVLILECPSYWRTSLGDGIYATDLRLLIPPGAGQGSYVGSNPGIAPIWQVTRHITLQGAITRFLSGGFLKSTFVANGFAFYSFSFVYRF